MASRVFYVGEQVVLNGTVVEARDAGNIAIQINGGRIIHVPAVALASDPDPGERIMKAEVEPLNAPEPGPSEGKGTIQDDQLDILDDM